MTITVLYNLITIPTVIQGGRKMEELMKTIAKNRFNPDYKTELKALNLTYFYCKQNYSAENKGLAVIFEHLYLEPEHFDDTKVKISLDLHVNERTLLRYRKKIVKVFSFTLEQIKQETAQALVL